MRIVTWEINHDLQTWDDWDMAFKRQIIYCGCWMGGQMDWLSLSLSGHALLPLQFYLCIHSHFSLNLCLSSYHMCVKYAKLINLVAELMLKAASVAKS
jgi:hypothetical protein